MTNLKSLNNLYHSLYNENLPANCDTTSEAINLLAENINDVIGNTDLEDYAKIEDLESFATKEELENYLLKANLPYYTPEMFGCKGDGITDDTEKFQDALDFIGTNRKVLKLTTGHSYQIKNTLTIKDNKVYSITSEPNWGFYQICPKGFVDGQALFIGENLLKETPNWTTAYLQMDNVNIRADGTGNASDTGATITVFRGLDFTDQSYVNNCKFECIGVFIEGTFSICSRIENCLFIGIREYFAANQYRLVIDDVLTFTGTEKYHLSDSRISNCYISGSLKRMPNMWYGKKFDNDTVIQNCFIENFEYLFGPGGSGNLVGHEYNNCIIQQCFRIFYSMWFSEMRFVNCYFESLSKTRMNSAAANWTGLSNWSDKKLGVLVKDAADSCQFKAVFLGCYVRACDNFIYVEGQRNSGSRSLADCVIIEKDTRYNSPAFDEAAVVYKPDNYVQSRTAYGEAFMSGSWFDTLNNKIYTDALPALIDDYQYATQRKLQNTFAFQRCMFDGDIYVAVFNTTTNFPEWRKITNDVVTE